MAFTDEWGWFEAEADTSDLLWEHRFGAMASATARGYGDFRIVETPGYLAHLQGGDDPDAMEIVLDRMAWLEGTVRDEAGNPLPAFPLVIQQWDDGPWVGSAFRRGGGGEPMSEAVCRADPRGRYSHRRIQTGEFLSIEAWPDIPGGASAKVRLKGPFEKGVTYQADIVVPGVGPVHLPETGPWVLAGVVVDDMGRPVVGARPTGRDIGEAYDWPECTLADGSFEFFTLGTDGSIASLWAEGFLPCPVALTTAELESLRLTGRLDGLRLTMNRTASIEVRVVDEAGCPVEGAEVAVTTDPYSRLAPGFSEDPRDPPPPDTEGWGSTDGGGAVRLDGLDSGCSMYVVAWKSGRTPTRISLEGRLSRGGSGTAEVVLPLMRWVPLEITVIGWTQGVELRLDDQEAELVSGVVRMVVGDGPHEAWIQSSCRHESSGYAIFVPRDSAEERVTLEFPSCETCLETSRESVTGESE